MRPLRHLLAGGDFPDAHLAHQIARGDVFAVRRERHGLHRRHMAELRGAIRRSARRRLSPTARAPARARICSRPRRSGPVTDATSVPSADTSMFQDQNSCAFTLRDRLALAEVVPLQHAVVAGGDQRLSVGQQGHAAGVALVPCQAAPVCPLPRPPRTRRHPGRRRKASSRPASRRAPARRTAERFPSPSPVFGGFGFSGFRFVRHGRSFRPALRGSVRPCPRRDGTSAVPAGRTPRKDRCRAR